ncbi:MAG: type II toxin-antitoxin system HicB family antitoxin [Blautia sp.]|nr:type II toxin-antitoxin system HicB family antitoxin [Aeriscardovia sp.]MBQ1492934.1 type II toxin-antitoxin system HicB family antitoxin [Blautia sp.]
MSRYLYPAIFEPEEGKYNVTFPDLPDCYTCGDNLTDAMMMAQDVLSDVLADHEETGEPYAPPSDFSNLHVPSGCLCSFVLADTDAWRRIHSTKAVKKTLTIPGWLNHAAEIRGLNFSQILQDALRAKIGV